MTSETFYVQIQYNICYKKPFTLKNSNVNKEMVSYQEAFKHFHMRFKKKEPTP